MAEELTPGQQAASDARQARIAEDNGAGVSSEVQPSNNDVVAPAAPGAGLQAESEALRGSDLRGDALVDFLIRSRLAREGATTISPVETPLFSPLVFDESIRVELPPAQIPPGGGTREPEPVQLNPEVAQWLKDNPGGFDVIKMFGNAPGSLWQQLTGIAQLFDPRRTERGGVIFPNLVETVALAHEVQLFVGFKVASAASKAGLNPLDANPRNKELLKTLDVDASFPRVHAMLDFYRQNYGVGPENEQGFWRYLQEDPFGFLTDWGSIISFGAGKVAKGAKAATIIAKVSQLEKTASKAKMLSRLRINKFLMGVEKNAQITKTFLDFVDPSTLLIRGAGKGLSLTQRGAFGQRQARVNQKIVDLEREFDIQLPASAKTDSDLVKLMERASVTLGNDKLKLMSQRADLDLTEHFRKIIDIYDSNPDLINIAKKTEKSWKEATQAFRDLTSGQFDLVEQASDLPASTINMQQVLESIVAERELLIPEFRVGTAFETTKAQLDAINEMAGASRRPAKLGERSTVERKTAHRIVFSEDPNVTYRVEYKVVELDELIPSHLDNFAENPEFPQELQSRDRTRITAQAQVHQMASTLAPDAFLSDLGVMNRGTPITGMDNVVESGNGRVMALRRARADFPDKFEAYQQRLLVFAPSYGLDVDQISNMRSPVLVRERITDVNRVSFVREALEGGLELSDIERTFNDVRSMSDGNILNLRVGKDENILDALNKGKNDTFVRTFMAEIPLAQRAGFVDEGGKLNRTGLTRFKNVIIAKTYSNGMLSSLVEKAPEGFKNLEKAVIAALPEMAQAEMLVRTGARSADLSIGLDVSQAVTKYKEIKRSGSNVTDFLNQGTLIDDGLTLEARLILPIVEQGATSPKTLAGFLEGYAKEVAVSPNPSQLELIEAPTIPKELLIRKVIGRQDPNTPDISEWLDSFVEEGPPVGAPAGTAGAVETPVVKPWTYEQLKRMRTAVGIKMKSTDPITTEDKRFYTMWYDAATRDLGQTIETNSPELAGLVKEANDTWAAGKQLANSRIGKRIWGFREDPSKLAPLLYTKSTSVEDVNRIRLIIGDEGYKALQAFTLENLFEKSQTPQGTWKPAGLTNEVRKIGKAKLNAIFGGAMADEIMDVAEFSRSFGELRGINNAKRDTFFTRLLGGGGSIAALSAAHFGGNLSGAAILAIALGGKLGFRRWLVSDVGQQWLMGDIRFREMVSQTLLNVPQRPIQLSRFGTRAILSEREKQEQATPAPGMTIQQREDFERLQRGRTPRQQ